MKSRLILLLAILFIRAARGEEAVILTPRPPAQPQINGPKVYGCRPGHPFLYRIPCTGERPVTFAADGLPAGLSLDPQTGIIRGAVQNRGETAVTLRATNAKGAAARPLKIACGDKLALTPPMGWNHWYTHYNRITDDLMRQAADAMVASGMADVGYQYVSIDDCWMNAASLGKQQPDPKRVGPLRDAKGNMVPNQYFPDMKALADYIHAKGLKAGLYTSPGPRTCAGFAGSYQHEARDAKQFADWGFDFLKYDWCSYGNVVKNDTSLEALKKPYKLMGDLLKQQDRDIVFNLCQYGQDKVWEWGDQVGHSWRTTDDLGWVGGHLSKGIYLVGLASAQHWKYAHPGAWNDPDYLSIGRIDANGGEGKPTPLTASEQYSHVTMWCLMASPLVFAGDMGKIDPFTLSLLSNSEVNDIDLDSLGKQAAIVRQTHNELILVKDMEDGSKAIGLFNLNQRPGTLTATWKDLGLAKPQRMRDPWRQKDVDVPADGYNVKLPGHGVALFRVWPK